MKHKKQEPVRPDMSAFDEALLAGLEAHIASKREEDMRIAAILSGDGDCDEPCQSWCGPVKSNEERLAYYRSHGLDKCDDYPGGDVQFEMDVLSGEYHNSPNDRAKPPKKEDAYVITKLNDGQFQVDLDFNPYVCSFAVRRAYESALTRQGYVIVGMCRHGQ